VTTAHAVPTAFRRGFVPDFRKSRSFVFIQIGSFVFQKALSFQFSARRFLTVDPRLVPRMDVTIAHALPTALCLLSSTLGSTFPHVPEKPSEPVLSLGFRAADSKRLRLSSFYFPFSPFPSSIDHP